MAVTRYTSVRDLEVALQALDATVEAFSFNSAIELDNLIEVPVPGKTVAIVSSGYNNFLAVVTATGTIAGVQIATNKGGHFLLFTGSPLAAVVLGSPPYVVTKYFSPKALEDALKLLDATATVTVYADESAVVVTNAFKILSCGGQITVVKCTTGNIAAVKFIKYFGGEYTLVRI